MNCCDLRTMLWLANDRYRPNPDEGDASIEGAMNRLLATSCQQLTDLLPGFVARDVKMCPHTFGYVSGDSLFKTWPLAHAIIPVRHMRSSAGPQSVHRQHFCAMNVRRSRCVRERIAAASDVWRSRESLLHLANKPLIVSQR